MHKKKRRLPRLLIVGVILLALLSVSALAYLSASTSGLVNTFEPAKETDPGIKETVNDPLTVKENVYVDVGNPGYAVYVRAAIVVNWEENGIDASGNKTIITDTGRFHATAPVAGTDYTISLNTATDGPWFLGKDGFYYHKTMVNPNESTKALINSCQLEEGVDPPDGYHLDVKIVAQTIQALGTTDNDAHGKPVAVGTPAVEDAWKVVTVGSNNELIPTT